jgi:hypothetical protein
MAIAPRHWAMRITACLALGCASAMSASDADADASVQAVWKVQHLSFAYRGSSTFYTCAGLQEKLRAILLNIGAREGLQLRSHRCDEQGGMVRLLIVIESPVEATPDNVRALTEYDSRSELVARVRGEASPTPETLARFPATWKTVSFARDRTMRLAPGDCELVRQVRREILPKLAIQIVRDGPRCSAISRPLGPPQLTVSALVAGGVD